MVPTMFGATVYRFVLIVEYPRLVTICGRKLFTLASGTPRDNDINNQTPYRQSLKGLKASRILSFSLTTSDESEVIRILASSFSLGVRTHQAEGDVG
jgi:hypothetical protein